MTLDELATGAVLTLQDVADAQALPLSETVSVQTGSVQQRLGFALDYAQTAAGGTAQILAMLGVSLEVQVTGTGVINSKPAAGRYAYAAQVQGLPAFQKLDASLLLYREPTASQWVIAESIESTTGSFAYSSPTNSTELDSAVFSPAGGATGTATARVGLVSQPTLDSIRAGISTDHGEGSYAAADVATPVAPDNASIAAIKTTTDKFRFTVANQVDANALTGGGGEGGSGLVAVDHNTGGADALRYMYLGAGAEAVVIVAYLKSEYSAGGRVKRGETTTGADGRWLYPLMLSDGQTYSLVASIPGVSESLVTEVTVHAA